MSYQDAVNRVVEVLERVVTECDETFVDPQEMDPAWVEIYNEAQEALEAFKAATRS